MAIDGANDVFCYSIAKRRFHYHFSDDPPEPCKYMTGAVPSAAAAGAVVHTPGNTMWNITVTGASQYDLHENVTTWTGVDSLLKSYIPSEAANYVNFGNRVENAAPVSGCCLFYDAGGNVLGCLVKGQHGVMCYGIRTDIEKMHVLLNPERKKVCNDMSLEYSNMEKSIDAYISGTGSGSALSTLSTAYESLSRDDAVRKLVLNYIEGQCNVVLELREYAYEWSIPLKDHGQFTSCLLYTSPSPRDGLLSRMPSSA